MKVPFNKWWPLPSHDPVPPRPSKFSFLKVGTITVIFRSYDIKPNDETVWLESWDIPLSDRIERSGFAGFERPEISEENEI